MVLHRLLRGQEDSRGERETLLPRLGGHSLPLSSDKPLDPGRYRLELYIGDRLAATADCVVQEGGVEKVFGPITFAEDVDRQDNPV
ncbi:MAG: hypothetical protein ACP5UM_09205, partial [Anaerolineae bacterium]